MPEADPKRQSGEQDICSTLRRLAQSADDGWARWGEQNHSKPMADRDPQPPVLNADIVAMREAADTIQALQERCGELKEQVVDRDKRCVRLKDLTDRNERELTERIAALEGALKAADKALQAMWKAHDRGEHGGSPGEWIVETMDQVATTLAPGGDGGEGQSVEERQGRSFHPKCPCVFHVVGQTIAPECPVHGQPHPTEPDRPEGE